MFMIIDSVISRIYSPNGESDLATVTFRDGRRRPVRAGDLVSGASIAQISINAMERACVREIETGRSGLRLDDLLSAIDEEFTRAVSVLTPLNCHKHLGDFPQDVEVASIDPVLRKTTPPHRYLRID